jgi:hypothetical protein
MEDSLSFLRKAGIAVAFAATLLGSATPATAAPPTASGETTVKRGQCWSDTEWKSPNGTTNFTFQKSDGNLVLYLEGINRWPMWNSGTNGRGASICFQHDGNLVIHEAHDGRVIWHSHTHGKYNAELVIQDDGNAVIYRDSRHEYNNWVWATHTCRTCS